MIRLLYNLLFPVVLLFFLPDYLLKMRRRGNYRRNFGQRFAIYRPEVRRRIGAQARTWIHAVSVGEVAIALKLAKELRALDPSFYCVLTTTTTTGFAVAENEAIKWMEVLYNPLDFWPIVHRALRLIRPQRIILVEAEVWPNIAAEARHRRIPIALVNARLSARSERRFRRFRAIVAPTFRCLDLVCAQEAVDLERWANLGVDRNRIALVGSIKYDPVEEPETSVVPAEILRGFGIDSRRPVLFGGSTHPGEEIILARVFQELRAEFPELVLIIAARHAERTAEIREQLETLGLKIALRSHSPQASAASIPDCLLLDTTGELRNWYSVATAVFIGKSLSAHGGQNPVEPILSGKPVVFGPHMENFATLAWSLLANGAALEIRNAEELRGRVAELLREPASAERLVANAERVLAVHRGATARTAKLLLSLGAQPRDDR
ncbi:MAG: 3-deoxy-D-manno-octulosonic acid transferase [Chthoniobacterales bacterium]